ncbi:MAG: alpha/beta fold hydrolase [Actinomycetaceae bacterium]|nr:alpha/beta fold hydrolase [Actinomycetaceae bacterium]
MAGLCALSLLLSGCSFDISVFNHGRGGGVQIEGDMPAVPAGLEEFYSQDVDWRACDEESECAEVSAPLDYENPGNGKTVTLALVRYKAQGTPIGTLFVNPGGPGASGIDYADSIAISWDEKILRNFDIVGWDPRGVGQSSAVDCLTDAELDEAISAWSDYLTDEGLEESEREAKEIADKCQANSGELLPYIGTPSTARDLDMLRHLVGDPRLYYYGASYGTAIGATYADLFPQNTGRLVLDGAVDLSVPTAEADYLQVLGFERAARKYVEQCKENCPLTGSDDEKMRQIQTFLDSLDKDPLPTSEPERPLTKTLAVYGVILPLYISEYDFLSTALEQAMKQHDGSMLLYLADMYNERNDDGTYNDNSSEAFWAINCADYLPTSSERARENGQRLENESLAFGAALSGTDICEAWPYHPDSDPKVPEAKGAAPILVVGTENDPATPYEWAQSLASQLESGHLLTWEGGEGHVAFTRGSKCIDTTIEDFLLTGEIFEGDKTCK